MEVVSWIWHILPRDAVINQAINPSANVSIHQPIYSSFEVHRTLLLKQVCPQNSMMQRAIFYFECEPQLIQLFFKSEGEFFTYSICLTARNTVLYSTLHSTQQSLNYESIPTQPSIIDIQFR